MLILKFELTATTTPADAFRPCRPCRRRRPLLPAAAVTTTAAFTTRAAPARGRVSIMPRAVGLAFGGIIARPRQVVVVGRSDVHGGVIQVIDRSMHSVNGSMGVALFHLAPVGNYFRQCRGGAVVVWRYLSMPTHPCV